MVYDCIIIGAGSAGLTAALKLSAFRKKVLLLERQPACGGLATLFTRKGFTFESAVHCVDALAPGQEMRVFFKRSGIEKEVEFLSLPAFSRIIYPGHDFIADFDPGHFKDYLKKNFPREEKGIERLFLAFEKFYRQFDRFRSPDALSGYKLILSPLFYPDVFRASFETIGQFISRYIRNPKLQAIVTDIWRFLGLPPGRLSALYFLLTLRGYYFQKTCYVKGGFGALFQAMAEKIKENGSEIRFNTRVNKIIPEKSGLKTVFCAQQEVFQAKTVISTANAIDTLTEMLGDERLKARYRKKVPRLEKSISAFQVYLGLKVPAKTLGMTTPLYSINTTYDSEENFAYCANSDYEKCSLELVDHAQVDPALAPAGGGTLLIMTLDNYANWRDLSEQEYKAKKAACAAALIRRAEQYLPGLSANIEVTEAGTPCTVARFGASPDGAIYGLAQTPQQSGFRRLGQNTGIKGLFLAGAWTFPGAGIHGCFISGIQAANMVLGLLREDAHNNGYI